MAEIICVVCSNKKTFTGNGEFEWLGSCPVCKECLPKKEVVDLLREDFRKEFEQKIFSALEHECE